MMVMMVLKKLLVKTMFKNSGDWTLQLPCGMIMSFTQTNQVMLLKKWTKKSNEMSDFKSVIGIVTKTVLVIQTFLDTSFLVLSIL